MKKKRNKGKKALTAVGAAVAAGLTPGIIAATPVQEDPNAGVTAAEVVAIAGQTYGFDELYAMQQRVSRKVEPQVATRYGVPPSQQSRLYGVPRPRVPVPKPPQTKKPVIVIDTVQRYLIYYCAQLIDADTEGILISLDSDLTRDLEMNADQLKELAAEIKERYGVEVSYHRFKLVGQLNTLRLVSEYIYKLKTVWE